MNDSYDPAGGPVKRSALTNSENAADAWRRLG
jgi:hypothetical protein